MKRHVSRPLVPRRQLTFEYLDTVTAIVEDTPSVATVVVMNPTHYAVALKYDEARMAAPLLSRPMGAPALIHGTRAYGKA